MNKNKYIIISGATATGKTQASIEVALYLADKYRLKAEIVNFDSLLFYKELNIGTAKPTPDEQKGILHHLVNIRSIDDPINASDFIKLAYDKIEELQEKNIIPILVGGSAFYIRALVKGMIHSIETPEISDMIKKEIQQIKLTPNGIIDFLTEKDPEIFNHIHKNDDYRLTRAAEFFLQNLKPYSVEIKKTVKNKPYDFSHNNKINGTMLHLSMLVDKVTHLKIIKDRAIKMVEAGLIEEVEELMSNGFDLELKPLSSIGYKETINYLLNKKSQNKDDLIESINISTRQLAKSQKTFFKKITPKITIDPLTSKETLFRSLDNFIKLS